MAFIVTNKGVNKATGLKTELAVDSEGRTIIAGYDSVDDANKIKTVQKKFRDNFEGSSLKSSAWEEVGTKGNGTLTVSSGTLTIASGTTVNADFGILSKDTYTIPFRLSVGLSRSQRIANNTFIIEAVSVNSSGTPDGLNSCAFVFDGTTATSAKYRVKGSGLADLDSALSSFPTTASTAVYELEPFSDEVWFHGSTLDSSASRNNSYRRQQRTPDPNALYKIRIRTVNSASAPASSTNNLITFVNVQDYAEITAEITAGRGQAVSGQGIGTVGTGGYISANEGTPVSPSTNFYSTTASTNLVNVKNSAGNLYFVNLVNYTASPLYFKMYNKASAPVIATDIPVMTITVPSNSDKQLEFGSKGLRFTTGISFAITAGVSDTDATATTANALRSAISYI